MAEFRPAFEKMIIKEGGFVLHQVPGDRGGKTYAGIAHNFHPNWEGWIALKRDPDNPEITRMVREFYRDLYWDKIKGDNIDDQGMAESIFDYSVNAGIKTASKLAQLVVDATPDGIIGPLTLRSLNDADPELFLSNFALAKITRYRDIVSSNPSQRKFLLGWINRTLEGLAA